MIYKSFLYLGVRPRVKSQSSRMMLMFSLQICELLVQSLVCSHLSLFQSSAYVPMEPSLCGLSSVSVLKSKTMSYSASVLQGNLRSYRLLSLCALPWMCTSILTVTEVPRYHLGHMPIQYLQLWQHPSMWILAGTELTKVSFLKGR